ncbi:putative aldolase [Aggregatibacter actinomycetemcomitans serotype e str. SC1083]|uniref:3-oxo-tetronate 4-phosphate decarboxylase n=1 Tax=Aggregatibacter actinomycetemcomitans serotype e str. SC1083 TaxID=907488 RepID=G4A9R2_AGGAC|nr:aldolase [Aggregatibacter actinomycetemcomitans]EGY33024.1 putative aldolase [Aggregatibacter actinomycetemcomitans serotype e str. SC1083]KYK74877.1 aldolase [Aggregatibacter actinomycetemcomitans serotype e str. SA3096]KYK81107.1 aldolase [Aggregatibacter actinomycetemcomitans serotype e str. SC936]KYK94280.1 aldolase [Aggregatibacter actinomycetemcomitans serotype e str. ANH9776]TYB20899.1 aldolase [Aggregatibacter actinomycetemcomitans]
MSDRELKKIMVRLGHSFYERGYTVGGAGNLSTRLDENRILVTPTGSSLGRLEEARLSILDMEGNLLEGDKPSKESVFHLAMYHKNPECKAIVHLHSTYLTALSCLENLDPQNAIKAFTPYYVMRVGSLPVIPYYRPGSPRIAEELEARALSGKAFLLANHGVVVTGKDLLDAADNTEELEEAAKLFFLLQGQPIRYLNDDEVNELKNRGK